MHPEEGLAEGWGGMESQAVLSMQVVQQVASCLTPPDGHRQVLLPCTLFPPFLTPSSCPPLTRYPTLRAKQREMHCS